MASVGQWGELVIGAKFCGGRCTHTSYICPGAQRSRAEQSCTALLAQPLYELAQTDPYRSLVRRKGGSRNLPRGPLTPAVRSLTLCRIAARLVDVDKCTHLRGERNE